MLHAVSFGATPSPHVPTPKETKILLRGTKDPSSLANKAADWWMTEIEKENDVTFLKDKRSVMLNQFTQAIKGALAKQENKNTLTLKVSEKEIPSIFNFWYSLGPEAEMNMDLPSAIMKFDLSAGILSVTTRSQT